MCAPYEESIPKHSRLAFIVQAELRLQFCRNLEPSMSWQLRKSTGEEGKD